MYLTLIQDQEELPEQKQIHFAQPKQHKYINFTLKGPVTFPTKLESYVSSQRGLVGQTLRSISRQNRLRRADLIPDSELAQKTGL